MLAEVGKLGNSYWDCLSKEVTGKDLEGLRARLEEIYSDPTTYLTPLGPAAKWVEQDIKEILDDLDDDKLSPDSWEKLKDVSLELATKGAKVAGKGAKWVKFVPIVGQVVGFFCDAAISQEQYKAQFGRLKAIDKWAHINLGLEGYKAIEGFFTQEKWEQRKDQFIEDAGHKYKPWEQDDLEDDSSDHATGDLMNDMEDLIKQIEGEGEYYKKDNYDEGIICYHFFRAWQIKPGTVRSGMSYDPERVEIEDPLMHGEPYPEII
jgi:hypothetical protein